MGEEPRVVELPRLRVVGALTAVMGMATVFQFAVGATAPFIRLELELSPSQLGLVVTVFFFVAVMLSRPVGALADRRGARRTLAASLVALLPAFAVLASSNSLPGMLVGAAIAGLPLAASNPTTNKLLQEHVSRDRQPLVLGLKQSGVLLSAMLAGLGLPSIAAWLGWRWVFVLLGAAAVALVALVLAVFPARSHAAPEPADGGRAGRPARTTGSAGDASETRWLVPAAGLVGLAFSPVGVYLPLYAFEQLGMSAATAGFSLSLMGLSGAVGRVWWGRVADDPPRHQGVLVALCGIAALAIGLLVLAGSWWSGLVWPAAAVVGFTGGAWTAVAFLLIVRVGPPRATGRLSANLATAFYAGFVGGPFLFGTLVERLDSYSTAWLLSVVFFVMAAVVRSSSRALGRHSAT